MFEVTKVALTPS